jgi:hypothetical protein
MPGNVLNAGKRVKCQLFFNKLEHILAERPQYTKPLRSFLHLKKKKQLSGSCNKALSRCHVCSGVCSLFSGRDGSIFSSLTFFHGDLLAGTCALCLKIMIHIIFASLPRAACPNVVPAAWHPGLYWHHPSWGAGHHSPSLVTFSYV